MVAIISSAGPSALLPRRHSVNARPCRWKNKWGSYGKQKAISDSE